MSEHKVTEEITQTGGHITARLDCSCGLVVEDDTRKTSRRALRSALAKLHEIDSSKRKNLPFVGGGVFNAPEPKKKSELTELRKEIQKEIKKQKKFNKQKPAVEPEIEDDEKDRAEKNWGDEAQYVDEPQ